MPMIIPTSSIGPNTYQIEFPSGKLFSFRSQSDARHAAAVNFHEYLRSCIGQGQYLAQVLNGATFTRKDTDFAAALNRATFSRLICVGDYYFDLHPNEFAYLAANFVGPVANDFAARGRQRQAN